MLTSCSVRYGSDLRPWLLEVNASPSLSSSDQHDYDLKCRIVNDSLNVIDMEGSRTGRETKVGGFDLIWNHGPVPETEDVCYLGCCRDAGERPLDTSRARELRCSGAARKT